MANGGAGSYLNQPTAAAHSSDSFMHRAALIELGSLLTSEAVRRQHDLAYSTRQGWPIAAVHQHAEMLRSQPAFRLIFTP